MVVNSLLDIVLHCDRQLASLGIEPRPGLAESAAGVIWRHARGQGLKLGDDWSWVIELYGPEQFREIVAAFGKRRM